MCGLCSRLRRASSIASRAEVGATKIALGHHRDDILETFFLNLFFGGKMKAMSPKLQSTTASTSSSGRSPTSPKRTRSYARCGDSRSSRAISAARSRPCSEAGQEMLREWESAIPAGWNPCSRAFGSRALATSWTGSSSISPRWRATGKTSGDGDKAFD